MGIGSEIESGAPRGGAERSRRVAAPKYVIHSHGRGAIKRDLPCTKFIKVHLCERRRHETALRRKRSQSARVQEPAPSNGITADMQSKCT